MRSIPSYTGEKARTYERDRTVQPEWWLEDVGVRRLLGVPESLLDCPVGTGRFADIYRERAIPKVVGVDVSVDMLLEAEAKRLRTMKLIMGDIMDLQFEAGAFELGVCIRLLNWLSADRMEAAFREMARVCRSLLIGISLAPTARPLKQARNFHAQSGFWDLVEACGFTRTKSSSVTSGKDWEYVIMRLDRDR
jgi:ubiquinone/menaquinone biosynthesis C-methylase UbiE